MVLILYRIVIISNAGCDQSVFMMMMLMLILMMMLMLMMMMMMMMMTMAATMTMTMTTTMTMTMIPHIDGCDGSCDSLSLSDVGGDAHRGENHDDDPAGHQDHIHDLL